MFKSFTKKLWILNFLFLYLLVLPSNAETHSGDTTKTTLVLGAVSHSPKNKYKKLKPMVDYAASHLKDLGIEQGSILIAKNNAQMVQYLREGKVDWVTEATISGIYFNKKTGAEIVLRKWKNGVAEYHTVFFTRKENRIKSLKDLKGKKIAFGDPDSTSSFYVPIATLLKEQYDLIELSSIRSVPPKNKVSYVFAGGKEINISVWVHRKLADVGAFSNLDWESAKDTPETFKKNFKIIHRTKPIPRAVELFRKDLDSKIKQRLKRLLLDMHNDKRAKEIMRAYNKTTKFDEIKGQAQSGINEAGEILKFVQKKLK